MSNQSVPGYVDTATPLLKWYGYNIFILVASLAMAYLGSLVLEYELAKLSNPNVAFIQTPLWFDITVSSLIIILGLANLAVLLFVFIRHLWLRRWMLVTTVVGWMLLAVTALVLNDRFLPILLPWYR